MKYESELEHVDDLIDRLEHGERLLLDIVDDRSLLLAVLRAYKAILDKTATDGQKVAQKGE